MMQNYYPYKALYKPVVHELPYYLFQMLVKPSEWALDSIICKTDY